MNKQILNLGFLSILLTLFVFTQVNADKLGTSAKSVKKKTCRNYKIKDSVSASHIQASYYCKKTSEFSKY